VHVLETTMVRESQVRIDAEKPFILVYSAATQSLASIQPGFMTHFE
jgi:hypothetical protein